MAIIKEVSGGKLHVEFDSVGQVLRAIDKFGWKPQQARSSDDRGRGDFHSFSSLSEAIDTYLNHPDRIRTFDMSTLNLKMPDTPGRDVEFDITGDYIDIDRHLQGVPEEFGRVTMGNPRNMFCTINILNTYVYYTKPEFQDAKARRVLRLVDWLENQNIRTQIVSTGDSHILNSSIVVKQFQDPFDLNTLAVVMHNDWLRRILFLVMEQSKTWQYGYGTVEPYDMKMWNYRPRPEDGLYVYVGGYMSLWNDIGRLNRQFDLVEKKISETIEEGMTFSEAPLRIGRPLDNEDGGWSKGKSEWSY